MPTSIIYLRTNNGIFVATDGRSTEDDDEGNMIIKSETMVKTFQHGKFIIACSHNFTKGKHCFTNFLQGFPDFAVKYTSDNKRYDITNIPLKIYVELLAEFARIYNSENKKESEGGFHIFNYIVAGFKENKGACYFIEFKEEAVEIDMNYYSIGSGGSFGSNYLAEKKSNNEADFESGTLREDLNLLLEALTCCINNDNYTGGKIRIYHQENAEKDKWVEYDVENGVINFN